MTVDIAKAFPDYERHDLKDLGAFRFRKGFERIPLSPIRMDSLSAGQTPGHDEYIFAAGHYWLEAQANQFHEWRYEFKVGAPGHPAVILTLVLHENRRDFDVSSSGGVALLKMPPDSTTMPRARVPRRFR